jgi:hypothetical protein
MFHGQKKVYLHSKKKLTHFSTKSSEIIISFRRAGSTLQKQTLLYKTQKNKNQTRQQNLYDIQIKTNKYC